MAYEPCYKKVKNYHAQCLLPLSCSSLSKFTVDGERFAGLNICGFSTIEVFTVILLRCLGHKCSLFSTIKERYLNSWKNFHGTPENHENHETLAQ